MQRFVRYESSTGICWGLVDQSLSSVCELIGTPYGDFSKGDYVGELANLSLLAPCEPTTIAAVAYNYKDLVGKSDRYDQPLVFLKATTTLIAHNQPIIKPEWVTQMWVEVELGIVIKKPLFRASEEQVKRGILGHVICNDVTARNICNRDHHLAFSKSQFSFCPVGSVMHQWREGREFDMSTKINGIVTQHGHTSDRILGDIETVRLISQYMPLNPGDLILTGTPAGAMDSIVSPGDTVELSISGIGSLDNPVVPG